MVDVIPSSFDGHAVEPLEGQSLLPVFGKDTSGDDRKPMFWEHEATRRCASASGSSSSATRALGSSTTYADRTELHDLAPRAPERLKAMAAQYDAGAERCGVLDRDKVVALRKSQGVTRAFWEKDEV